VPVETAGNVCPRGADRRPFQLMPLAVAARHLTCEVGADPAAAIPLSVRSPVNSTFCHNLKLGPRLTFRPDKYCQDGLRQLDLDAKPYNLPLTELG